MDSTQTESEMQGKFIYASDGDGLATNLRDGYGYLIMPEAILKSVGALGARLMGAIMAERRPSQPEIFKPVEAIAEMAFLSVSTTRKLLAKLSVEKWLEYRGRECPSINRRCRRTATWIVTDKSWKHRRPWIPWPKWLGKDKWVKLPPACHAVYGMILQRWCLIERGNDEELGSLDGREYMSIADIRKLTGLSYNGVVRSLVQLKNLIVDGGGWYDLKAKK